MTRFEEIRMKRLGEHTLQTLNKFIQKGWNKDSTIEFNAFYSLLKLRDHWEKFLTVNPLKYNHESSSPLFPEETTKVRKLLPSKLAVIPRKSTPFRCYPKPLVYVLE